MLKSFQHFAESLSRSFRPPDRRRLRHSAISAVPAELLEVRQLLSAVPARPGINQPEHNARVISWSEDSANDTYDVWINNLTTGQSGYIRASNLTLPEYLLSRRPTEGRYRIWVRAVNEQGRSPWSVPVDLVLSRHTAAPSETSLVSPLTAESGERVTFTWQAASRASLYELWVSNLTTGAAAVIHETALTGDSFTTSETLSTGRYRAWLRAHNAVGAAVWSEPLTFQVIDVTSPPSRPVFRASSRPGQVEWDPIPFADTYEVWANNLTTGESRALYSVTRDTSTYFRGRRIDPGRYRFWVRATNETGQSAWSAPYDSILATKADRAPNVPRSIDAEVSDIDGNVTLSWHDGHVEGHDDYADYYEVWVNDWSRQRVLYQKNVQAMTLMSDNPLPNGRYQVWIRASNAHGRSRWSAAYSFSVNLPTTVPQVPVVRSLSFGDLDELQLVWTEVQNAASYEVQLQNEDTGADWTYSVAGEHSNLTLVTSRRPSTEINYVLRVRAVNLIGSSEWSSVHRFTSPHNYFRSRGASESRGERL